MAKKVKNLKYALDTTSNFYQNGKHCSKKDLTLEFPGFRMLCLTRWTVRGGSLQSVIDNWNLLQEL